MLAAIAAVRFARRAHSLRTAIGTPAPRRMPTVAAPATESELAALAWNVGAGSSLSGLTVIAEIEGLDAAIACRYVHLRARRDRVVICRDSESTGPSATTRVG